MEEQNLYQLPNEIWVEIFKLAKTAHSSFDLVQNSTEMENLVLRITLQCVSKGMQRLATDCLPICNPAKYPIAQWATLFAHLGFVSFLKELDAKKHVFIPWIYLVAEDAGQTEAMSYLATKVNVKTVTNRQGWQQDVQIVVEQTVLPKWKCFETYAQSAATL